MTVLPHPSNCMLLLVDLQVAAVSSIRTINPAKLKDNAIALATVAQLHQLPSVLTAGRKPGVGGIFLPELRAILKGHTYVERTTVSAFETPAVCEAVVATGRTSVIMAGIATDIGLLYAALGAKSKGFDVWVVLDVAGTTDREAEEIARLRLIQNGIGLVGWAGLAIGLMGDFSAPLSLDTIALMAQRMETAETPFG